MMHSAEYFIEKYHDKDVIIIHDYYDKINSHLLRMARNEGGVIFDVVSDHFGINIFIKFNDHSILLLVQSTSPSMTCFNKLSELYYRNINNISNDSDKREYYFNSLPFVSQIHNPNLMPKCFIMNRVDWAKISVKYFEDGSCLFLGISSRDNVPIFQYDSGHKCQIR